MNAHRKDYVLHQQLAMMDGLTLPMAIGVIRDVEASSYESDVAAQVEEVKSRKNYGGLRDMILKTTESWVVE